MFRSRMIAVIDGQILIASYITPEGDRKYAINTKGDMPMTSYLGLLVVAQQDVLGWGSES